MVGIQSIRCSRPPVDNTKLRQKSTLENLELDDTAQTETVLAFLWNQLEIPKLLEIS